MTAIDELLLRQRESTRRDACRPLDRHDPSKQGLFCYPERRGVECTAGVAPARDEEHTSRATLPLHVDAAARRPRRGMTAAFVGIGIVRDVGVVNRADFCVLVDASASISPTRSLVWTR